MPTLQRIAYWAFPSLLCIVLYWNGLTAWFQMDDFAWLTLHRHVVDWKSFLSATFEPQAQGTIRPLSERLFFMGMQSIFGMDAFPFRMAVFVTQFLNLILLALLTRRLTRSAFAGFLAPLLWLVNPNISLPMVWTSAYNQILCATVLLSSLHLFVRFTETGLRRYYVWQWVVFLLGFGVLELVVVYPALALLYAIVRARSYWKHTLPMFLVAVAYAVLHRWVQAPSASSVYSMHLDASMFATLFQYVNWALGPVDFARNLMFPVALDSTLRACTAAALFAFTIVRLRKGDGLPLFFLGWFVIVLGPYLPLRDHFSGYYLTIPTIGLAMLGAHALASVKDASIPLKILAAVLALTYSVHSAEGAYKTVKYHHDISIRAKDFVQRLAYAQRRNPGKTLLVKGVDSDLFWAGVYDQPYAALGFTDVFLTGDTEALIEPEPGKDIGKFFLPDAIAYEGLRAGDIVVYQAQGTRLRNVTQLYRKMLESQTSREVSRIVQPGFAMYASQLGEGWYTPEQGHRWMGRRATFDIAAPTRPGAELIVAGSCPEMKVKSGPSFLKVSVNGQNFPPSRIDESNLEFEFRYPLPAGLEREAKLRVALEVDRTFTVPPDSRQLGLVFQRFEVTK